MQTYFLDYSLYQYRWVAELVRKLTNINTRPSLCRNHHVLELMQTEAFPGHAAHGVIKHLAGGICVFDLVSR